MTGLFDCIDRTDTCPKRRSENTFAYWNRSARAGPNAFRELLEAWFSHVPANERHEMRERFRAGADDAMASVFHELCLYELLFQEGCQITFHPPMRESTNRPDYGVRQTDGTEFLIEAISATVVSTGPTNSPRRNRIADRLHRFRHDGFAIGIDELREGSRDLRWIPLERHIRSELARIGPQRRRVSMTPFKNDDGWKVRLTAIPALRPEASGKVLYEAWHGTSAGPAAAISAALQKKATRYGDPDRPYVIAVNSSDPMCSDRDFDTALFGHPNNPRIPAFWGSAQNPSHTRVSAVLFTANLWPATILMGQVSPCLYLNPWAKRQFQGFLTKLKTVCWHGGALHRTHGMPLHQLLGTNVLSGCRDW